MNEKKIAGKIVKSLVARRITKDEQKQLDNVKKKAERIIDRLPRSSHPMGHQFVWAYVNVGTARVKTLLGYGNIDQKGLKKMEREFKRIPEIESYWTVMD